MEFIEKFNHWLYLKGLLNVIRHQIPLLFLQLKRVIVQVQTMGIFFSAQLFLNKEFVDLSFIVVYHSLQSLLDMSSVKCKWVHWIVLIKAFTFLSFLYHPIHSGINSLCFFCPELILLTFINLVVFIICFFTLFFLLILFLSVLISLFSLIIDELLTAIEGRFINVGIINQIVWVVSILAFWLF